MPERCPHCKDAKIKNHGQILCTVKKCKVKIEKGKCVSRSCSRKKK